MRHLFSSTSSSDGEQGGEGGDEKRFERRVAKSLVRSRERFLPFNMEPADARQGIIKDRQRLVGASCTDIDPMSLDQNVSQDKRPEHSLTCIIDYL